MIYIRKNSISGSNEEVSFVQGEKLSQTVQRTLELHGFSGEEFQGFFQVAVNGLTVEKDLWDFVEVKEEDLVLISPKLKRGEGGQLFKTFVILGVTLAAAYTGVGLFALTAITIGTSLLMNALIPPPGLPGLGIGGGSKQAEESQMYAISGQNNSVRKYGYVPKVYGTHRVYPIIAANPYTEIEADPGTGNLVQFYYGIFDFGYGPLEISDIKIGDTPISNYSDYEWRLVDLNRPAVPQGLWDDQLHTSFSFYKGDVERDGASVVLNKNQIDANALADDYQVIRNASPKVNDNDQEIALDFVCPSGLIAYGTDGSTSERSIDLEIHFSKVGQNDWVAYNNLDYVYDFSLAGGTSVYQTVFGTVAPIDNFGSGPQYQLLSSTPEFMWFWDNQIDGISTTTYVDHDQNPATPKIKMVSSEIESWGYPKGMTYILLQTGQAEVRDAIYVSGNLLGRVESIRPSTVPGYSEYVFKEPTENAYTIFQINKRYAEKIENEEAKFPTFTKFVYSSTFVTSPSLNDKVTVKKLSEGAARITANSSSAIYATFKFKPKEKAAYKVRVVRKNSSSPKTFKVSDNLTLSSLSTRFDREPIRTDKRHVFLEIKIRATNQINGVIQNLSAVASSILPVYQSGEWVLQRTNNPAWVFADLLTSEVNKKAVSKDRLHLPSIIEWAEFCDAIPQSPPGQSFTQKRFQSNFILDFDTTLQSILNQVSNAAQASLNIVDGKYGVLIDKNRTVPVQIFTPRNSWGFSSQRSYNESPHALKIRYVDPFKNWEVQEAIVYDSGYNEETALTFEEISSFGCTNYEQAWRLGRYLMAQSRLRKENISLQVDFEHLIVTRGDYVQITQDVMKVGGTPARVKSVTGNVVKIDDGITTQPSLTYGCVFRNPTQGIKTAAVTIIDSDEFSISGPNLPSPGDLIVIGEMGKIVYDCIVKSISPNSDLSASLELVEKADDIYLAESSDSIPDYDPQISLTVDSTLATPPAVQNLAVVANSWRVKGSAYEYYIDLDWDVPTGAAIETYEIYVDNGTGYDLYDYTQRSFYEYIVKEEDLNIFHSFKVLGVSSTGKKITLLEAPSVSATPLKKVTPPSNVSSLYLNITNEVLQLDWIRITDEDLKEYIVRYSPKTVDATWESSIALLRADRNSTLTSTQARTGTYFIKALDLNGNQSSIAAQALTSIPNLFNLNVITETNDFPNLNGELVTTEKTSGALMLKRVTSGGVDTNQYFSEGFYYYANFLDLGSIFSVRLQSLIEAEGFTVGDLMSQWNPLSDVRLLSLAGQAEWDVETQYRTTDRFNVMAEWAQLSLINPLSEGQQDNWSPFRKFTIGDVTGRIFQFRLRLISVNASVTPRVFEGKIRADMPDRIETYNNLTAPASGLTVSYSPAFMGPGTSPNIQITLEGGQSGDTFTLDNKTLEGFRIRFYDKDGNAVIRQFDAAVKGYGRKAIAVI